ncbi:MAG: hypothetical protein ACHP7G_00775 [Actinomycetales bacterium]
MTTLVATAHTKAHTRTTQGHIDPLTTPGRPAPRNTSQPTVDCPACGEPATIEWRDMVVGTGGPVVHVKLKCPLGRHWFLMPEVGLR